MKDSEGVGEVKAALAGLGVPAAGERVGDVHRVLVGAEHRDSLSRLRASGLVVGEIDRISAWVTLPGCGLGDPAKAVLMLVMATGEEVRSCAVSAVLEFDRASSHPEDELLRGAVAHLEREGPLFPVVSRFGLLAAAASGSTSAASPALRVLNELQARASDLLTTGTFGSELAPMTDAAGQVLLTLLADATGPARLYPGVHDAITDLLAIPEQVIAARMIEGEMPAVPPARLRGRAHRSQGSDHGVPGWG